MYLDVVKIWARLNTFWEQETCALWPYFGDFFGRFFENSSELFQARDSKFSQDDRSTHRTRKNTSHNSLGSVVAELRGFKNENLKKKRLFCLVVVIWSQRRTSILLLRYTRWRSYSAVCAPLVHRYVSPRLAPRSTSKQTNNKHTKKNTLRSQKNPP